jgi:hypothetical protein
MPEIIRKTRKLPTTTTTDPNQSAENWGRAVVAGELPIQREPEYDELDNEETPLDRLSVMLSDIAGDDRAELKVYKSINGALAYCKSYTPAEFENGSFELLRRECGPGKYELRLYGIGESGRFVVRARQPITIAELPGIQSQEPQQNNQLAIVLESMAKNQADMMRLLTERKDVDPMANMTSMLSMMGLMREAMGLNNQPQNQKSSIGEIVDAIKELKSASEIVNSEKSDNDSPMAMLGQITDLVKAGVLSQANKPQPQQVEFVQKNPIQSQPQQNDDMNPVALMVAKSYIKQLIIFAEKKEPAQKGCDFIYDKLPDEMVDILALDNWFDMLSELMPESVPHKEWLTEARNLALTAFDAPESSE